MIFQVSVSWACLANVGNEMMVLYKYPGLDGRLDNLPGRRGVMVFA